MTLCQTKPYRWLHDGHGAGIALPERRKSAWSWRDLSVKEAHDPATMENHAARPEIQQVLTTGKGRSVRHSETVNVDMLYLAARYQSSEGPPLVRAT